MGYWEKVSSVLYVYFNGITTIKSVGWTAVSQGSVVLYVSCMKKWPMFENKDCCVIKGIIGQQGLVFQCSGRSQTTINNYFNFNHAIFCLLLETGSHSHSPLFGIVTDKLRK